jgi:formate C-acetyltransferase
MITEHRGSIVFCCEDGFRRALESYGVPKEEAYNFEISGCYESRAFGDESSTSVAYVNAVKPLMLVLYNGFDTVINEQLGEKTGALEEFSTFEKLKEAFLIQWKKLILDSLRISNEMYDPYLGTINPSVMYTATIEKSLEKGVDGYSKGVTYNNTHILNCGFASMVDSLMAVKYLVYDQKLITLSKLKNALEANWQGYEKIRAKALTCPHKYANNDPVSDEFAGKMAKFFADTVNSQRNGRGGVCKAIMHSARQYIEQGRLTGATPDGRLAGTELSKNASPSVGMDKSGVTALINSALMLDPASYRESFCVDVMLHPSAVSGEDGLSAMRALLYTYMKGGGMSMQFNVFDAEMLKDARQNPEKYKNLQVRVCGWNVLWNNLSAKEQDAYIQRAEVIGSV